ncbi:MAG: PPOX class F420-dependent oxidoreductase [Dehalococcoidia bacterium]
MIGKPEQDAFVRSMKWASITSLRKDGSPTTSVVFYAVDGDDLLFSTTNDRLKAKSLRRDPRAAVTVLDEGAPYRFVSVEGKATVVEDDIIPGHIAVNRAMRGVADWQPPEGYEATLRSQGRVIIRVTPERVSGVVNRG